MSDSPANPTTNPRPRITAQTWTQPPDDCQANRPGLPSDMRPDQRLSIQIEDAGAGAYAVIRTRRWAMDKEDLAELASRIGELIEAHDRAVDEEYARQTGQVKKGVAE